MSAEIWSAISNNQLVCCHMLLACKLLLYDAATTVDACTGAYTYLSVLWLHAACAASSLLRC
jgi:hypothetical protein